jgi:hypothetical protein
MLNKQNLLQEAIADAKAIKEAALANAKAALTENFTPHLKSILSQKINELEEEMEETEDEISEAAEEVEELDLESLLAELDEADESLNEAKEDEEDEKDEKDEEEDEFNLEDMSEEELEKMITNIVKDMLDKEDIQSMDKDKEIDLEIEDDEDDSADSVDENINLDELLSEILDEKEEVDEIFGLGKKKDKKEGYKDIIQNLINSNAELVKQIANTKDKDQRTKLAEPLLNKALLAFQQLKREMPGENVIANMNEFKREIFGDPRSLLQKLGSGTRSQTTATEESLKSKLNEAYKTINHLRSELNEINLLNAKLLYVNKIFKSKNLNESQKLTILETFDKAKNVSEVKLVYETLNGGISSNRITKSTITENKGSASQATKYVKQPNEPIIENSAFERMKQLAFYQSNH